MNEKLEQVIWAMREASDRAGLELTFDACAPLARAAVEALREPTDALAEVMNHHASNGMVDWRELHKAMIDEILK